VGLVLPEIVEAVGAEGDAGDAVLGLQDLQRAVVELLVARVGGELGQRALILLARPRSPSISSR
jgi:hypothetical protein